MRRLEVIETGIEDKHFVSGCAEPTSIEKWIRYFNRIRPQVSRDKAIPERQRRNLGYRMQLLEFECALLLLYGCARHQYDNTRTLHETIASMKTHQVTVLTHCVLAGIGEHFVRVQGVGVWQSALVERVFASQASVLEPKKRIRERLDRLTALSDRVDIGRIGPDDPLSIDAVTFDEDFKPTYETFRMLLTALNSDWPSGTCLNEEIA